MSTGPVRTILLIEDDDAVRRVLVRRLRTWGYPVIECASGEEGVRAAREHRGRIDLVLSDMVMPGITGAQAAEQIAEIRPGLPVVFMSGHMRDDIMDEACAKPRRYFLEKPFEFEALAAQFEEIFSAEQFQSAPSPVVSTPIPAGAIP